MMRSAWFRRLPIRHKLVTMIMATAAAVLVLASVGYLVVDYVNARNDMVRALTTHATLIMENSTAALLYGDRDTARDNLTTLMYSTHVRAACMYDDQGAVFAEYSTDPRTVCPASPGEEGAEFRGNRLHLVVAPPFKGQKLGSLYLRSDVGVLQSRLRAQTVIVAILLVLALGVGLVVSARLQGLVSEPVTALAGIAAEVSSKGDYSIRAARRSDDELGVLVDAFNRMLDRIQQREQELSNRNEDLRREVAERRRAEQERAELLVREREANRLKDEFLATLSHELRTPLNAILGWTKLLRANAVPAAGVDAALEKVERNARAQTRLVEDLLEVSRIASGKLRLDLRPFDLIALANTAIDSIRPTAEARGVTIERQFEDPALPTGGDPDRLQQVIWNLLSNAVKFTPPGGTVRVSLRRVRGSDELVVADTGMGIDPAFLPSVFDTFRQADASSTRAYGGLGLGLSIVRHLVEMHGGEVQAKSAGADKGAVFTVRLPVRRVTADAGPSLSDDAPPTAGRLSGRRIAVVEDDADTRELLVSVLQGAGAEVFEAASAAEGLIACEQHRPDALVSDIAMPGQDGYALMARLRSGPMPIAPRVSVAVTAFGGPNEAARSAEAGFDRHVVKPIEPAALVEMLAELLAQLPIPNSQLPKRQPDLRAES